MNVKSSLHIAPNVPTSGDVRLILSIISTARATITLVIMKRYSFLTFIAWLAFFSTIKVC